MIQQTVIALGFFDGVHLGHGALLRRTAERAAYSAFSWAFSWAFRPSGSFARAAMISPQARA